MTSKEQLLGRHLRRTRAAGLMPLYDEIESGGPTDGLSEKMAHWSNSLEDATVQASQWPVHTFSHGCLYPDVCRAWRACELVFRRARAIYLAKESVRAMYAGGNL